MHHSDFVQLSLITIKNILFYLSFYYNCINFILQFTDAQSWATDRTLTSNIMSKA